VTTAGLYVAARTTYAARPSVVGFIYVGPRDDYGYNQAHAQGAAAVAKLSGVKVLEEEKVPETADVQKTMASMINLDGATLLFPTSFGYFDPHVLKSTGQYSGGNLLTCRGAVSRRETSQKCRQLFWLY
jgi:simple sugar transport system substrate-binding protein